MSDKPMTCGTGNMRPDLLTIYGAPTLRTENERLKLELAQMREALVALRNELRIHARSAPFSKKDYIVGRKRADDLLSSTKALQKRQK
jgi:hypothetical protein